MHIYVTAGLISEAIRTIKQVQNFPCGSVLKVLELRVVPFSQTGQDA